MASEALGFPSTSFMNHSSSSIYNLLGISVRVYVFFFHSFSTIQAEVSIEGTWLKGQMNAFNFTAQDMGSPEIYELSHMLT